MTQQDDHLQARKGALTRNWISQNINLRLFSPRIIRNEFLLFKPKKVAHSGMEGDITFLDGDHWEGSLFTSWLMRVTRARGPCVWDRTQGQAWVTSTDVNYACDLLSPSNQKLKHTEMVWPVQGHTASSKRRQEGALPAARLGVTTLCLFLCNWRGCPLSFPPCQSPAYHASLMRCALSRLSQLSLLCVHCCAW